MKNIFFVVLLLASLSARAGWVENSIIGVRDDNSKSPIPIFVNTYGNYGLVRGVWHRISLSYMGVPVDAKSVFLSGLLIITHGYTEQTCDLNIAFRAPGDSLNAGNYIGQTIESAIGGGQRSNMSTWTPAKNGEIEFQWNSNTNGDYPAECAYGINLSAQAYVR